MAKSHATSGHDDLLTLFAEWREFERPPTLDGAPDYTAETFNERYSEFLGYRERLNAMNPSEWPVAEQVDWHIVHAEINGFDFNHRVLKPWIRDPAFYQSIWNYKSDVPGHEGPTHHVVTELWTYDFPLSAGEEQRLLDDLAVIPPLMKQAQKNLTGNAKELWIAGIRNIEDQGRELEGMLENPGVADSAAVRAAIEAAKVATDELIAWLWEQSKSKTGPSGIGKENYTWYAQNVHLVPLTWEDEVRLLKRELDRAWASLKLEEHRNRKLPPLVAASTPEEYEALADRSATKLMEFLRDENIVTVADYFEPALRAQLGEFVPEESRNFFAIAAHYDPTPLYSHSYHWFELARMEIDPHESPVRQVAALYNIFDSRNEGTATGVEEMFMHAGLYEDRPRVRELVWIMLAQRAARGLGSLYAQANEMTMEEAGGVHMEWTPRGWMKTEKELLKYEQHLYMRQPGYGTSYVTGKYLLERTLADYGKQLEERGEDFSLKDFFDQLNAIDCIPIALGRWEMTGLRDEIDALTATE